MQSLQELSLSYGILNIQIIFISLFSNLDKHSDFFLFIFEETEAHCSR